jgi:hypothetical protein
VKITRRQLRKLITESWQYIQIRSISGVVSPSYIRLNVNGNDILKADYTDAPEPMKWNDMSMAQASFSDTGLGNPQILTSQILKLVGETAFYSYADLSNAIEAGIRNGNIEVRSHAGRVN